MAGVLNYVPHGAQREIHEARGFRFRTVCTGLRFGKTLCLAAEVLDRGGCDPLSPQEEAGGGGRLVRDYGWVAPTYNVAERGIEAFRQIADGVVSGRRRGDGGGRRVRGVRVLGRRERCLVG